MRWRDQPTIVICPTQHIGNTFCKLWMSILQKIGNSFAKVAKYILHKSILTNHRDLSNSSYWKYILQKMDVKFAKVGNTFAKIGNTFCKNLKHVLQKLEMPMQKFEIHFAKIVNTFCIKGSWPMRWRDQPTIEIYPQPTQHIGNHGIMQNMET